MKSILNYFFQGTNDSKEYKIEQKEELISIFHNGKKIEIEWKNLYAVNIFYSEEDPFCISDINLQIYFEKGFCELPFLENIQGMKEFLTKLQTLQGFDQHEMKNYKEFVFDGLGCHFLIYKDEEKMRRLQKEIPGWESHHTRVI